MARERHLANAPITEAIVDFVFEKSMESDQLRELGRQEAGQRPGWVFGELNNVETTINLTSGEQFKQTQAFEGVRLQSQDEETSGGVVFQYRTNRATISHVGNYDEWSALERDGLEGAAAYAAALGDENIKRMGVRFINFLSLSAPICELVSEPPTPMRGDWSLKDFMGRRVYQDEVGHRISVTLATVTKRSVVEPGPGNKGLMLDIDVVKECSLRLHSDEMLEALKELRKIKNAVFFGMLQEAALEGYA